MKFSHLSALLLLLSWVSPSVILANDDHGDDDDDGLLLVTCGSAVKLSHLESKTATGMEHFLSSEGNRNLGSGSGQQIVTAVSSTTTTTTTNTLWWIRGPNDESRFDNDNNDNANANGVAACTQGVAQPIACGSVIRLSHLESLRNLHSHNVKSPLSRQQEVSAFGEGDGDGDNGDDWRVVCSNSNSSNGGKNYWERSSVVSFQHVDSGAYLGASSTVKFTHQNCGHNCPILNHLEVFGRKQKDHFGNWVAEMGVHLSK
mmetsp:Transcript_7433/g.21140  ORF Transcript_7433/g.21140 Transcript_7433/m.21140 type:complete len:259 (+) Transcript_7433:144-920(+)